MRVTGTRVDRALQQRTYPVDHASQPAPSEKGSLRAAPAYKVTLSATARDVAMARRSTAESPAIRGAKVAAIKDAVAHGTYAPSSHDIAQKIMEAIGLVLPIVP